MTANSSSVILSRRSALLGAGCMALAPWRAMAAEEGDMALRKAIDSSSRPAADRVRDVWRHPYETLTFWGLRPGMKVIDLQPGGGYWTQILAPYLAQTGGTYIAGLPDISGAAASAEDQDAVQQFKARFADHGRFGAIQTVPFGAHSGPLTPDNSIDLIFTAREIHNWIAGGYLDHGFKVSAAALRHMGTFGVEEHRADPVPQVPDAANGYVSVATVEAAGEHVGLWLEAESEINANPRDHKKHPFGVWTLPPSRTSAAPGKQPDPGFDRAKYDAIGESDRMTVRFRKPGTA